MPVDYMETMGVVGGTTVKHPQTCALGMKTFGEWKARSDDILHLKNKYLETVAKSKAEGRELGMLDQVGIGMQLVAQNPWFLALVSKTLTAWETRIPDAVAILNEFQEASNQANKS
jgi:hypothetical protein